MGKNDILVFKYYTTTLVGYILEVCFSIDKDRLFYKIRYRLSRPSKHRSLVSPDQDDVFFPPSTLHLVRSKDGRIVFPSVSDPHP